MAARDRWGQYPPEPAASPLQRYIQNACDPSNYEPNLALNLEICDLINQKKGNTPREAAVAIVQHINSRNPNVSLLALTLLDICVKNCGYPFHLQISTKEFLNELVRRFPERPPIRATRVQLKVLEAIEEWRSTICQTSRYKEDLGYIRDMHRLLSFKGYTFPEVRQEDAAVLNTSDNLKSAEEMEEEERAAQSAKLQELIRRGTPADLQEANHLMKIMAGYDQTSKTDYRQKAAEDIAKLQEKQRILDEMLASVKPGETIGQQDAFEELANALQSAQPKLHKMAEEESDDTDAVVSLFKLNDSINVTVQKYKLIRKGDLEGAAAIKHDGTVPDSGAQDLIDLMGDNLGTQTPEKASASKAQKSTGSALEDDLLGLSFQDSSYGLGGGISLGFGTNSAIPGPPLLSSTQNTSTARLPTPETSSFMPVKPTTFAPTAPNYDPFKSIAQAPPPPPNNTLDILGSLGSLSSQATQLPLERPAAQAQNGDDEFTAFSSALPPSTDLPPLKPNEARILSSKLQIVLEFSQRTSDGPVVLRAKFSNGTDEIISDLKFQLAVTKSLQLKMEHQSATNLQPKQRDGITQIIRVAGVSPGEGNNLRMRWRVSYRVGNSGQLEEETGDASSLPVS